MWKRLVVVESYAQEMPTGMRLLIAMEMLKKEKGGGKITQWLGKEIECRPNGLISDGIWERRRAEVNPTTTDSRLTPGQDAGHSHMVAA